MILGVLGYGAVSGYDLNKAFQASIQHFWNTEQSQIYRALHKLADAGWVEIEHIAQDDVPDKKIYHLTEAGRAELRRWQTTPQPYPTPHEGWLGQLFFGAGADLDGLEGVLDARIDTLRKMIARYETDVPTGALHYAELYGAQADLPYWLLTLDYGIERARFDLQWAEAAKQRLREIRNDK
jgi:PadR family transcriptional regulator, regulatory protein AphA